MQQSKRSATKMPKGVLKMGILNRLLGPPSGEKLKKREIKVLIKALEAGRDDAEEALVKTGEAAVEPLIAALKRRQWPGPRCRIVITLGKIRDVRALEPLIALLEGVNENPQTRYYAAQALGQIRDSRAVKPLIAAVVDDKTHFADSTDRNLYLHSAAHEALMNIVGRDIGEPSAGPLLVAYLKDESWNTRDRAAWMLGEIRDVRAVEALVICLNDEQHNVRSSAKDALVKIGKPAVDPLVACLKAGNSFYAAEALVEIGSPAVEALVMCLNDGQDRVRSSAKDALVEIGKPAVDPLVACLKAENSFDAAVALVEIGGPAADVLVPCLKDSNSGVRELITKAVMTCLQGPDNVRQSAGWALVKIKDTCGMAPLVALARSNDWGRLAVKVLEKLLNHSPENITEADLKTLVQLDDVVDEIRSYDASGRCVSVDRHPIDCSLLRQLARQELIRRGNQA
jgi:HEAT repeat protein